MSNDREAFNSAGYAAYKLFTAARAESAKEIEALQNTIDNYNAVERDALNAEIERLKAILAKRRFQFDGSDGSIKQIECENCENRLTEIERLKRVVDVHRKAVKAITNWRWQQSQGEQIDYPYAEMLESDRVAAAEKGNL